MKQITIMEITIITVLLLTILLLFGCTTEQPRNLEGKMKQDSNFMMDEEMSEKMQEKIITALDLPENSDINDIKLALGLSEDFSQEELMQALSDKNILGGRLR